MIVFLLIVTLLVLLYIAIQTEGTISVEPIPKVVLGIDKADLLTNTHDLVTRLQYMVPYRLELQTADSTADLYSRLDKGEFDMIVSRTHTLAEEGLTTSQFRIVCNLIEIPVNILTTNQKMTSLNDLRGTATKINVGLPKSSEDRVMTDLLTYYGLVIGRDVVLTHYTGNELLDHYGKDLTIVVVNATHPNDLIKRLSAKALTKFVELSEVNEGQRYYVSLNEEPFYKRYPFYHKSLIDKTLIVDYYPHMNLYNNRLDPYIDDQIAEFNNISTYINSLSVNSYIVANTRVDNKTIGLLVYNLYLNLAKLNNLEYIQPKMSMTSLANIRINIPIHDGALDVYRRSDLIKRF